LDYADVSEFQDDLGEDVTLDDLREKPCDGSALAA